MQGLIIENISNCYKIKTEKGIYKAIARGKFKKEDVTPAHLFNLVLTNKSIIQNEKENSYHVYVQPCCNDSKGSTCPPH